MKAVVFYPHLAKELGGVREALYFQTLVYWSDKTSRKDGFFYKTQEEIEEETTISVRHQRNILNKLIKLGYLKTKLLKANGAPTLHYQVLKTISIKTVDVVPATIAESVPATIAESMEPAKSAESINRDFTEKNINNAANAEEINAVLNTFKKNLNPYIRFNNKTERKAASELIQELGLPQVLEHIKDAERFSEDEFAPRITTPYELKTKLAKLILHKKKNSPKTVTERKLTEKQQKEMNEYGFLTTN